MCTCHYGLDGRLCLAGCPVHEPQLRKIQEDALRLKEAMQGGPPFASVMSVMPLERKNPDDHATAPCCVLTVKIGPDGPDQRMMVTRRHAEYIGTRLLKMAKDGLEE